MRADAATKEPLITRQIAGRFQLAETHRTITENSWEIGRKMSGRMAFDAISRNKKIQKLRRSVRQVVPCTPPAEHHGFTNDSPPGRLRP